MDYINNGHGNKHLRFGYNHRKKQLRISKNAIMWALEILLVVAVAFVIVKFFGGRARCADDAMKPEASSGNVVLVNNLAYDISAPSRGDVALFYLSQKSLNHPYVRRVAGLPGETIQIINGQFYVNGSVVTKGIHASDLSDAGIASQPITLGTNEYFVLSDNSAEEDSRSSEIGNIGIDEIKGQVWFQTSPGASFGFIH